MIARIKFTDSNGKTTNIFELTVKQTNKKFPAWMCSIINILRFASNMESPEAGSSILVEFKKDDYAY